MSSAKIVRGIPSPGTNGVNDMFEGLLSPRGVAVIGASQNPSKLGYGVARNLVVSGYPGAIHFVNPSGGYLFDRPLYPGVESVPDPVDLAVIMIPAQSVPEVLEACGRRGIGFAIVGSGGFGETGEDGIRLEQQCMEIAQSFGIRVLGPNCIGYLDTHLPIDTSFLPLPGPIKGDIAFLSHSGAICESVIDWARGQGFGLSRLLSLGNQMDLNEGDLLPPTAADPNTRVVAMYLEGVGDGANFIEQAMKVTRDVPVVAIKVGRSEGGREAVVSHTGALAGRDVAFDAAFRKAGVIRARHSEEMFDWARALAWCQPPSGPNMAVLTNAGGPGVIAADALDDNGLRLAKLADHTREKLGAFLPSAASLTNPVDMLAGAGPREYADSLRLLLADDGVEGIIVILPPPPMTTAAEVAGAIIPVIQSATKPIVIALMGEELIAHAARLFRGAHIPDYRFPERAASALRVLYERSTQLRTPSENVVVFDDVKQEEVESILKGASVGKEGFATADISARIVNAYGIHIPEHRNATNAEDAESAAEEIGFPVALKADSFDLTHKSDSGAVSLDLRDISEVVEAYRSVLRRVRSSVPRVEVQGVMVQAYVPRGQDVIVGFVRDLQFGPLLMFGAGGTEVELLEDVSFALAPLSRTEAEAMVNKTWAGRRLRGYRSTPAVDREAVIESLLRISQLALENPQVAELEINPLRALDVGSGVQAIDVRLRLHG
jgi:acetyl coenzyme A synthetase (ADP forming)-like protein